MAQRNPEGFKFVMQFAGDNGLRVQADRRTQPVEVVAEIERRA
jgi:hypothetical protein